MRPRPVATALLLACAAALALSGCGKSKEQLAIERMQNRKKPGMVRLVNLTDGPLSLFWMGRDLGAPTTAGTYNRFANVGYGKQEVGVGRDTKPLVSVPLNLAERELYTIVATGSGNDIHTAVLTGEFEYPTETRNIQVFFIDENGKPAQGTVTLTNASNKYDFTDKSGGTQVAYGTYNVAGSGVKTAVGGEVTNENTYSLLVVKRSSGDLDALLLRNTYIQKPVMAGAN